MDDSHPTDELDGLASSWTDWSPRNSRLGADLWMSLRSKSTSWNARLPIWRVSLPGPSQADKML